MSKDLCFWSVHDSQYCAALALSYWMSLFQDIFAFGPPCCPFSILNQRRLSADYNPFLEPDAEPFIAGCRHVRTLAKPFRSSFRGTFQWSWEGDKWYGTWRCGLNRLTTRPKQTQWWQLCEASADLVSSCWRRHQLLRCQWATPLLGRIMVMTRLQTSLDYRQGPITDDTHYQTLSITIY